MTQRSSAKLRSQSTHVLWSLRQLLELAEHLERRHDDGVSVMSEPVDAAVLEAFCVHARALVEFLWRDRLHHPDQRPKPRRENALAADWFEAGEMPYKRELPPELHEVPNRTGWGVAHISYTRLREDKVDGWDHVGITHLLACRFADFAQDVDPALVAPGFRAEAERMIVEWRATLPPDLIPPPPRLSATPAYPSICSQLTD